jgi:hypothetical protein
MGKTLAAQHPAVVLRSHYKQLRALLAITMIAVVGLSAAVVILATNDDRDTSTGTATQGSAPGPIGDTRYDGGSEEGSRGVVPARQPGVRYDGGPEEGTRGPLTAPSSPGTRYDGGPEEGSRGSGH